MGEYVYSYAEDGSWYDTEEEAIEKVVSFTSVLPPLPATLTLRLYEGERQEVNHKWYTPNILEYMQEQCYNSAECPEEQDDPFGCTKQDEEDLQKIVDNLVGNFIKERNIKAGFYMVDNVENINVRVELDENGDLVQWDYLLVDGD